MGQTIVYVVVSVLICVSFFAAVDHFLLFVLGLDFWYFLRK